MSKINKITYLYFLAGPIDDTVLCLCSGATAEWTGFSSGHCACLTPAVCAASPLGHSSGDAALLFLLDAGAQRNSSA